MLVVTLGYTENVAIATMMTHFDRASRELSNGASPNSLKLNRNGDKVI